MLLLFIYRYISIDIYGGCGELKCTKRSGCRTMLSKYYKFYLAFENSNCIEYVTEKAGFQALMSVFLCLFLDMPI